MPKLSVVVLISQLVDATMALFASSVDQYENEWFQMVKYMYIFRSAILCDTTN